MLAPMPFLYATGLPGGYVRQKEKHDVLKGDCFSACVSMLTGIDLDILPVHPPQMEIGSHDGSEWVHVYATNRWDDWVELLADNGFALRMVDDATTYIGAAWTPEAYAHAVVVHNGIILNPASDEVIRVEDCGWIIGIKVTVTPL